MHSSTRGRTGIYEQFIELAPDAMVAVGQDGRISLVNAQTVALFGHSREELIGQPVELLIPGRFARAHPAHRDGYFHAPRVGPMGADLGPVGRRRDGSEFPAEISLSSIETDDGTVALAAIRDVSERFVAEQQQADVRARIDDARTKDTKREREGMELQLNQLRRLESVGQLAGGIAHDFNNILGLILNYTDFVAGAVEDGSPVHDDVEEIRRAAERAVSLTRQLLIFSRREVVRPQVLDISALVLQLDRLMRGALGEQVELETRFAPGLARVKADPGQLEQVLINLVVNARDAMPAGGRLLIEAADVRLSDGAEDLPAGDYVRISVSDTGVGMDPEVAARVFEPFFTTKPKGEGTGLGLAAVYGIITDAGGGIEVRSEPGAGTTVTFHLPASDEHETTAPAGPATRASPEGHGETVLVVEDEDGVRALTQRILVGAGYNVLTASRGAVALEICAREDQPIDLVLTDVVMPGMLGPELAEKAEVLRPGLTVLFMSGHMHQVIARQASGAQDFAFVEKPFTAAALLLGVRAALDASANPVT